MSVPTLPTTAPTVWVTDLRVYYCTHQHLQFCFSGPHLHGMGCCAMAFLTQTSPCCCCHSTLGPSPLALLSLPPFSHQHPVAPDLVCVSGGSKPQENAWDAAAVALGAAKMQELVRRFFSHCLLSSHIKMLGKSSQLLRAVSSDTGQLDPAAAYRKVGRGKGKPSHLRVPSPMGTTPHIPVFSFPSKEAGLWRCPSCKGK